MVIQLRDETHANVHVAAEPHDDSTSMAEE
jgi:hypothetical protein